MYREELEHDIEEGVVFWGYERNGELIGTWADAVWAIRFYEKRGFKLVPPEEKNRLIR